MFLTRRRAIWGLAAGVCISTYGLAQPGGAVVSPWVERLRRLVRYPESAREVGRLYRRAVPAEADVAVAAELILSSLSLGHASLSSVPERALRRSVADRMRDDFAAGRTVKIGGWVLSTTEARLCALWV